MRRRMSIRYSMTPTAAANGGPMPARGPALAAMVPEMFTVNISIITNIIITEAITLVTIIPVVIMAVALVCWTAPLVEVKSSTVIRTVLVLPSWKMNLPYRLTRRKLQVIVEQPFPHQLVPKLRAIQLHRRLVHRLCHFLSSSINNSSNNTNPNNICFLVHRPAAVVHHFNSNSSNNKLHQPNNNIISNLNKELTHRQTNRMSLNLRNHSKLLPVDLQFNALF